MTTFMRASGRVGLWLCVFALTLGAADAQAQRASPTCRPAEVIPSTGPEPPAKMVIGAPLPGPLASRGVVVIPYCAEHMRLEPIFGPGALTVSPRVGHVHVTVDDAPWHWADASGTPIILRGLPAGHHKVVIALVDANHGPVDQASIEFDVPPIGTAVPRSAERR